MRDVPAFIALVFSCLLQLMTDGAAGAGPQLGTCSGTLSKSRGEYVLGQKNSEDICILSKSDALRILKICGVGKPCVVSGLVEDCKDSGECSEISHITSIKRGKK